jgi:hypothetical protein
MPSALFDQTATQRCAGDVPGNIYIAPGPVLAVFVNGVLQRPTIDYSLFFATITLTRSTELGDSIYALCIL